ncbi:hypothetical protein ZIOFF_067229 [Zingiber officinale]|uniref:Phi-1 n=1 Tax=Zingiber officinale TaxID=94328 RepID=A0A8J5EDU7_ZINOF|nr:hypothetical protein ZIOFF_067229 [Zingiber officinale]
MSRCGSHWSNRKSGTAYIWVGNAAKQCPGQCAWPFHQPLYGPQTPPLVAPNGDVGADGMVINLASMVAGAVTNPFGDGFYQGPKSAPLEAATACPGVYAKGSYPGYAGDLKVDPSTGASYNANGVGDDVDDVRRPHLLGQTPIPKSMQGLVSSPNPWIDLTWLPNSHAANSSSCASLAGLLFPGTRLAPFLVASRVFFCACYRWIHIVGSRECWWIKTRLGWGRRRPTAVTGATSAPHAQRCRTRRRRPGRGRGMAVRCPSTSTPITSRWGGSAAAAIACTTLD